MKSLYLFILLPFVFISCKEVEDPAPFVNLIEFKISTDVPIENLTMIEKLSSDKIIFPKKAIELKRSYTGDNGNNIYEYSETINISENATVELIIPKNIKRKLFTVRLYDKVNIDYFFDEDGLTKKRFSVPEKNKTP
ncbi:hypothetical protein GCM10009120_18430 [Sphingobacterium siyangense subsp. cladoniae]|uniref:hypothetical protein n=1 Tax=Sphingobacterium siyangense TaxID=459529 RepID=UPI0031F9007B